MESWEKFREKQAERIRLENYFIDQLLEWAKDYKLKIAKTEPPDEISYGKFIVLDDLIDKLTKQLGK